MNEFSVYQWFVNGDREDVLRFVDDEQAVRTATNLASSVGARLGTTVRVMITDGMDYCVWEWKFDEGIVFPTEVAGMLKRGVR
jgi:hypothetical protein